jgi:hypothetical protein
MGDEDVVDGVPIEAEPFQSVAGGHAAFHQEIPVGPEEGQLGWPPAVGGYEGG